MFSVNQITRFFNQLYLQKNSMKWPDFLHVDLDSHKVKFDQNIFGRALSNMGMACLVM